jgi:hypothetical protein
VDVGFYANGAKVCSAKTAQPIAIGMCIEVGCTWTTPPGAPSAAANVNVVVDDGGATPECDTGNDKGLVTNVFCVPSQ